MYGMARHLRSQHQYKRAKVSTPERSLYENDRVKSGRPSGSKPHSTTTTCAGRLEQDSRMNRSAQHVTKTVQMNDVQRSKEPGSARRVQSVLQQRTPASGTARISSAPSPHRTSQSPNSGGHNIHVIGKHPSLTLNNKRKCMVL